MLNLHTLTVCVCHQCLHMQARKAAAQPGKEQALQRAVIIFNLFALETLHVAEALGVPCIAISPCLVPYSCPSSFSQRFQKAWPTLYDSLHNASEGVPLPHIVWPPEPWQHSKTPAL